jgi:hypothetical protein
MKLGHGGDPRVLAEFLSPDPHISPAAAGNC